MEPGRLCVGDRAGSARFVFFPLGNPSVVQTWAGTDRVDVSVQLLVSFIIVLRYYINNLRSNYWHNWPLLNNIF